MTRAASRADDVVRSSATQQQALWDGFRRTIERVAFEEEGAILARFAGLERSERVLEVGCGTGRLLQGLRPFSRSVVGVDLLAEAVRETRAHGIVVVQANAIELPFGDETFDVVLMNDVIHNLPAALSRPVLTELARVAGRAVVLGAIRNRLAIYTDIGYLLLAAKRRRWAEASSINADFLWFGRARKVIQSVGLRVSRMQPSSRYRALYEHGGFARRLYRLGPGNIGLFGWMLPRPYRWLQYDLLLVKEVGDRRTAEAR